MYNIEKYEARYDQSENLESIDNRPFIFLTKHVTYKCLCDIISQLKRTFCRGLLH